MFLFSFSNPFSKSRIRLAAEPRIYLYFLNSSYNVIRARVTLVKITAIEITVHADKLKSAVADKLCESSRTPELLTLALAEAFVATVGAFFKEIYNEIATTATLVIEILPGDHSPVTFEHVGIVSVYLAELTLGIYVENKYSVGSEIIMYE